MKKQLHVLLLGVFVCSLVVPALGNYREDFLYTGHYIFMKRMVALRTRLAVASTVASVLSGGSPGGQPKLCSFYSSSELPEWDIDVFGGAGMLDADHQGIQGYSFEADVTTLHVGVEARKDRWSVQGIVHHEDIEGKGTNGTGLDSINTGFVILPGYRFLMQEDDGVNLDVQGIFDFSYRTHTQTPAAPSAWYVNPGVMVSANRTTPAGLFQASYAYDQLRNISGDKDQFTGKSAINSHALAFDYVCRLTEQLMGNVGISYITLNDMPTSMDRQFTDLNLRLGSDLSERCSLSAGYSQAIDGRGTNGFDVSGAWAF